MQTEGFGPLIFGFFMALFEDTPQPGAPYLMAAIISFWAFLHSFELPEDCDLLSVKHHSRRKGEEDAVGLLSADELLDEM